MNKPSSSDNRPPMAAAMEWVSKITMISLEMVLPGLAGSWADNHFQTKWIGLFGFILGFGVGLLHLLQLTKSNPPKNGKNPTNN